jgi:hypothetical protein
VDPEHRFGPQAVPGAYLRHAPDPSHMPSLAHVEGESIAQSLSGSVPPFTLSHTPLLPPPFFAALQAWQDPAQGWSQQTPSTQFPLTHCEAARHVSPLAWSAMQWLVASQNADATQSRSDAHVIPHAPPLQTYGAHAVVWPGLHVPAPSQA